MFAVNPMAASRYRDRHGVSRKKSDPGDALVLANFIRTDMHMHRPLPADSDLAQAIAVLARAHQDAVWNRQQIANQLRLLLREYYPVAIEAWRDKAGALTRPDARKVLGAAPTLALAAQLPTWKFRLMLTNAGRKRGITEDAERLHTLFRQPAARQPAAGARRPWASRPRPYLLSSMPPASLSTSSRRRSSGPSAPIPTRRSCSASPASGLESVRPSWPRSVTTGPGSPPPAV